jgi:hypothetical protein
VAIEVGAGGLATALDRQSSRQFFRSSIGYLEDAHASRSQLKK